MASNKTRDSRSEKEKKKIVDKNGTAFVQLDGLSQSARDRQMNNRSVRRPKNLGLIEREPADNMDFMRNGQVLNFPSEFSLSSTIKEANGADCSNHAIEEYWRKLHDSESSPSPDDSDEYTTSSSKNNSTRNVSESQEDYSSSVSDFTTARNTGNESESRADNAHEEINLADIDEVVSKCRYSKNAAIRGMLKQKIISLNDLDLDVKKKESEPEEIQEYPNLVPHPEDPEFFTHPLQAYGKTNDAGIDFRLARLGTKNTITSRQYYIRKGLDDDLFAFKPKKTNGTKPKTNVKIPMVNRSRTSSKQTTSSPEVYDPPVSFNDENDSFVINSKDFPTLK